MSLDSTQHASNGPARVRGVPCLAGHHASEPHSPRLHTPALLEDVCHWSHTGGLGSERAGHAGITCIDKPQSHQQQAHVHLLYDAASYVHQIAVQTFVSAPKHDSSSPWCRRLYTSSGMACCNMRWPSPRLRSSGTTADTNDILAHHNQTRTTALSAVQQECCRHA